MIRELTLAELDDVSGAGELGDAIRAVGDALGSIGDACYEAGYRLGKAISDAMN